MPKYRHDELKHIHQEYLTGRELAEAGLLEDAIQYFDKVLVRLPRRRRDRVYRIENASSGHHSDNVHLLPPIFRDALLAKVYCLNELGRFNDAYKLLERAIELDPDNPQVYAEIGFAHGAQDNLEEARAAYLHALDLEPDNPAHLRALTHIDLLEEHFDDANALALRALAYEPDSMATLHQLAYARYRLGDLDGAIGILRRTIKIDPNDRESVLRLVGTLREAGHIREAVEHMGAYLQTNDADPEALGIMTELLQQDGTMPELDAHVQRLIKCNPNDPSALDLQAWGYYQQGKLQESLDILRRLILIEPMQANHHFKLGLIHETMGHLPLAMASLLRAASLDQDGEIRDMAAEAISNLDQAQIEQIIMRIETDYQFRQQLQHNTELALIQAGYLLSPLGLQVLQSFDFNHGLLSGLDLRSRTVH
ncbi:MAG TPA: tetratricopeptide repeat protein [Armatimonadota bacterium]|nr:tetratricopeptide repeat protein [Armatimonadota bacterium]